MDLDLSSFTSVIAIVLPYLSYLVHIFSSMFDTLEAFFNLDEE